MSKVLDCVIIGAGPSGLSAANILAKENIDFIIIEKGDYLYNRNPQIPKDIVSGIGGGGLYSDGKISFYPSGSKLYQLKSELLLQSYLELEKILNHFSIAIPAFDENWLLTTSAAETFTIKDNQRIHNKQYNSVVLSDSQLSNLGFYLYDQIGRSKFLVNHSVTDIQKEGNIYHVSIKNNEGVLQNIKCRNIIYAGGKFGSLALSKLIGESNLTFKKFEVGIRIETNHEDFDFKDLKQTDLKLLIRDDKREGIEFRTFCFCRNGYIVHGEFEKISSFNGVSNKSKYSKTNFGINLRIESETTFLEYKDGLLGLLNKDSIINQPIADFLNDNNTTWAPEIHDSYKHCLQTYFPQLCTSRANVTGPSFEYFGYYPLLNNELKLHDSNFWVTGDSTGDFRGLLPSLVSGFLAGNSLVNKLTREKEGLYDLVRIKPSLTTKTKTIFTAQSKKFFYCKDAICEFVFNRSGIPINPFQVFGYFLGDRVDRDLVRKGNNELIARCDELWVFGPIADGVLFEISRAYELKMPVRFFSIETYANSIEEITDSTKLVFEPEVHAQIGKERLIKFIERSYEGDVKRKRQLSIFDDIPKK
ncbi:MAG: hypothetical protein BGO69_09430 [Bacteroidetes bacterium 46-16]|nr:MAG: hypothetical protein BGO69_09430 [Bacteroidetes bacterium 46-16]